MNADLLTNAFEKYDDDYSKRRIDKLQKISETKKKNAKHCKKIEDDSVEKVDKVEKPNYYERKAVNQFNSLIHEEKLRLSKLKTKRVHIDQLNMVDNGDISEIMNVEMDKCRKSKTWKSMDMCFKWNLVNEYLYRLSEEDNVHLTNDDLVKIKKAVQTKTLDVVYDKPSQTIKSIQYQISPGLKI